MNAKRWSVQGKGNSCYVVVIYRGGEGWEGTLVVGLADFDSTMILET